MSNAYTNLTNFDTHENYIRHYTFLEYNSLNHKFIKIC